MRNKTNVYPIIYKLTKPVVCINTYFVDPIKRFYHAPRAPKALFIPTASGDALGYCASCDAIYSGELGCKAEHLLLYSCDTDRRLIRDKVLDSDIVYVGGGNTLKMMTLWRRLGVDAMLRRLWPILAPAQPK